MYVSTGAARSTPAATSSPTSRANTSRSVRTPTSRSSASVTNTESPVPVRWIASRQSAIDVPGGTITGSPPADHRQGLRDEAGDARGDGALGEFGHRASVRGRARSGGRGIGRDPVSRSASDTLANVDGTRATGIALVVISAIAFGSGGLFAKPVYATGVDWLTLMAWRFAIGGGLAWVVLAFNPSARRALRRLPTADAAGGDRPGRVLRHQHRHLLRGAPDGAAGLAALIVYLYPPIVAVLALRLGRPLQGRRAWGALGIAVLGVVLALGGIPAGADIPVQGLLLTLASPVFYSIWIILAARVSGERSDRVGTEADDGAAVSAIGAIMLTSTAVVYWIVALGIGHPVLPAAIPSEAWPGIVGVAIVAGFVPVQAFYAGAQRIGAAQASLVSTVEPLWTIAAAGVIYGERLEPVQLLGGALILGGVLLSQTGRPKGAEASAADAADSTPVLPQPVVRLSED